MKSKMKKIVTVLMSLAMISTLAIGVSASSPAVTMPDMSTVVTPDIANQFINTIVSIVPILLPIVLTLIVIGVILSLIKRFTR
ncbi:MAG: hypothetical protein FWF94_03025 [Oscillospiraceae bacterium]|nr:hypothetical protein [Oscillospiraceae bacterium]